MLGLFSYNQCVIIASEMEIWKARNGSDGPNGTMNPLGNLLFGHELKWVEWGSSGKDN